MVFKSFSVNAVSGGYSAHVFLLFWEDYHKLAEFPNLGPALICSLQVRRGQQVFPLEWYQKLLDLHSRNEKRQPSSPLSLFPANIADRFCMSPSKLGISLLHLSLAFCSWKKNHVVPKCMEQWQCHLLHWTICPLEDFLIPKSSGLSAFLVTGVCNTTQLSCAATKTICWSLPGARTWSGRAFLHAQVAGLWILLCNIGFLNVLGFTTPVFVKKLLLFECTLTSYLW